MPPLEKFIRSQVFPKTKASDVFMSGRCNRCYPKVALLALRELYVPRA